MRQARRLLKEMMISAAVWTVLTAVVLLVVSRGNLAMAGGCLLGGAACQLLLWHMFRHLDIALDLDPKRASRHIQVAAMQRMGIMAVTLAVSMYFYQYAHPLGTILTLFGVKISAFVHPFIEKHGKKRAK